MIKEKPILNITRVSGSLDICQLSASLGELHTLDMRNEPMSGVFSESSDVGLFPSYDLFLRRFRK